MMADLIEKVARERIKAQEDLWGEGRADEVMAATEHADDPDDCADGQCDLCWANEERRLARTATLAVLDGIREPTPEMSNIGGEVNCPTETLTSARLYAAEVWQAMIDQLRKEVAGE